MSPKQETWGTPSCVMRSPAHGWVLVLVLVSGLPDITFGSDVRESCDGYHIRLARPQGNCAWMVLPQTQ